MLIPFMPTSSSRVLTSSSVTSNFYFIKVLISSDFFSLSVSKVFRCSEYLILLNCFSQVTISGAFWTKRVMNCLRYSYCVIYGLVLQRVLKPSL